MSNIKIFGNHSPVVGVKEYYSINELFGNSVPKQNFLPEYQVASNDQVKWSVWIFERGSWRKTKENDKIGTTVDYIFYQKSLNREGIKLLVEVNGEKAIFDIKPLKASQAKIVHVDLLDTNLSKPTKPFVYGDWIVARVHCVGMDRFSLVVTLWEDDGGKTKQSTTNVRIQEKKGIVLNGKADVSFQLKPSFAWLANAKLAEGDTSEGEFHEYYVTAEFLERKSKRIPSLNTNIPNPDYKPEVVIKQTPAEKKGPSKKEVKGINKSDNKVYDYHETKVAIKPTLEFNPVWEKINNVLKVNDDENWWKKKEDKKSKLIIFPLLVRPENDKGYKWGKNRNWAANQNTNMTTFNSNRNHGKRKHAGRDLYTDPFTEVVAIADGIVLSISDFYCKTHQVTLRHTLTDGRDFVIRYGELDSKSITVKVGDKVSQKKVIGKTGKLLEYVEKSGKYIPTMKIDDVIVYMLHFECFNGSNGFELDKNPLTNFTKPFQRRSDLIDPINLLKEGYKNSFGNDMESSDGNKELFNEEDARMALLTIYKKYGEDIAIVIEKMYRLETSHFTSEQYQYCGTGGMEVFGKSPYYGWDSTTFKQYPEYSPIGTWSGMEGKGLDSKGGNAQQKDLPKIFVKLPSVLAGMIYKAEYINRYNGNYACWYNKTDTIAQEIYRESLKGIIPRIVRTF